MKFSLTFLIFAMVTSGLKAEEKSAIDWQPWSDTIFEKAKAEQKLVLLDLGAGWCHWCHVMDEVTYADADVKVLLAKKYIAVRVDQDSRPDLSNRYEDYGWPATIVFKWDGTELAKRQGYIPPKPMASMLAAFIDDPSPGPSVAVDSPVTAAKDSSLTAEQRASLKNALIAGYDRERGGWGDVHKYLNWDAMEYCLTEGNAGDAAMENMARQTLEAGRKLIDPVWGGVYQYSTDGDWDHPHFEKIIPFQAENLRIFSIAASQWNEPKWLDEARKIRGYLKDFMTSPDGAFYTSQDADLVRGEHSGDYFALDDAGRRKLGIPLVDKHVYARENGLVITGLASLYASGGDESCLADATKAANWVIKNRSLPGGGFCHDEKDAYGPYLGDTLAMGRAFLSLYTVTADRMWLKRAEEAAAYIDAKFRGDNGFNSAVGVATTAFPAKPQLDENIALVRFTNLLNAHTGEIAQRAMAEHAMRYLAAPMIADHQGFGGSGILLADRELGKDPSHFTIVGGKDEAVAQELFQIILRNAPPMSRIEWFDSREGKLRRGDVDYPTSSEPQAFVCTNQACSLPIKNPAQLEDRLRKRVK